MSDYVQNAKNALLYFPRMKYSWQTQVAIFMYNRANIYNNDHPQSGVTKIFTLALEHFKPEGHKPTENDYYLILRQAASQCSGLEKYVRAIQSYGEPKSYELAKQVLLDRISKSIKDKDASGIVENIKKALEYFDEDKLNFNVKIIKDYLTEKNIFDVFQNLLGETNVTDSSVFHYLEKAGFEFEQIRDEFYSNRKGLDFISQFTGERVSTLAFVNLNFLLSNICGRDVSLEDFTGRARSFKVRIDSLQNSRFGLTLEEYREAAKHIIATNLTYNGTNDTQYQTEYLNVVVAHKLIEGDPYYTELVNNALIHGTRLFPADGRTWKPTEIFWQKKAIADKIFGK